MVELMQLTASHQVSNTDELVDKVNAISTTSFANTMNESRNSAHHAIDYEEGLEDYIKEVFGNKPVDSPVFDKKATILKNIFESSPYTSMSELFKKVLIQVIMTANVDTYDFVEVPAATVGLVVGVKGSTIKYIQDMTCTKIISPSRDMQPIFTVVGKVDAIKRAANAITYYVNSKVIPLIMQRKSSLSDRQKIVGRKNSDSIKWEEHVGSMSAPQDHYSSREGGGSSECSYKSQTYSEYFFPNQPYGQQYGSSQSGFQNRRCMSQIEDDSAYEMPGLRQSINNFAYAGGRKYSSKRPMSNEETQRIRFLGENFQSYNITSPTAKEMENESYPMGKELPFCMMCYSALDIVMLIPCKNGPFCKKCSTDMINNAKPCPVCSATVLSTEEWEQNNNIL